MALSGLCIGYTTHDQVGYFPEVLSSFGWITVLTANVSIRPSVDEISQVQISEMPRETSITPSCFSRHCQQISIRAVCKCVVLTPSSLLYISLNVA